MRLKLADLILGVVVGVVVAGLLYAVTYGSADRDRKLVESTFAYCEKNPKACPGYVPEWKRNSNIDWN